MKKTISSLLVTILGLALLIYSATRSLDFISATLPADRQILAYFGLAALDGGLLFWLFHFLSGARGAWQRGISLMMLVIDFIGCVAMFTLDTLYRTGQNGLTATLAADQIQTAILALSGIIAMNIAATVASHLTDPETRKQMAAEEANDQIEAEAIRQISEHAPQLAAELAPQLARDWMSNTRSRYLSLLQDRPQPPALSDGPVSNHSMVTPRAPAATIAVSNNGNGHRSFKAEMEVGNDQNLK